jgi:parallel beta helix pectate lyase-like protein
MPRIITFIALLTGIILFTSCEGGHNESSQTDSVKAKPLDTPRNGYIDTGSKTIGATIVKSLLADKATPGDFKHSGPLRLTHKHDTVIEGIHVSSILLVDCNNVTIKNCLLGPGASRAISLATCTNIHIDNCYIRWVPTAIYVEDCQGISVTHCQALNMVGPYPQGQFVQFKRVHGGGNRISFNRIRNEMGLSYPEDAISMYMSSGLPDDPIVIEGNWIRGGGPSKSGGGIMLGDAGGANIVARNNILVDPGQYGMAVSGGSYMSIVNNTVYGKTQPFTSTGIYYKNYTKQASIHITIAKNAVNFTNAKNKTANTFLDPAASAPKGWHTNMYDVKLDSNILPAHIVSESLLKKKDM